MFVVATDTYPDTAFAEANGIAMTDFDDLIGRADYVSMRVFGGADNAALIDAGTLGQMKPGAALVNLARGEVVDLDAVAEALETGTLAAVAIDAYVTEPPDTGHRVFSHPRAIFTPHSGADTKEAVENVGLMVIESLDAAQSICAPPSKVNRPDPSGP